MTELDKYQKIYNKNLIRGYGYSNCGRDFLKELLASSPKSVVDIGCGKNCFIRQVKTSLPEIKAVGLDFACPSADIICDAKQTPFLDKEFEWLTCFDALEHLRECEVDDVLVEFKRISSKFAFSICYRDSVYKVNGETLHPTVKNESWWMEKIKKTGATVSKSGKYICGEWLDKKLTIGMVVYDDFDGFYFTIQALRMYHSEAMRDVEFVIINTNPQSALGEAVKSFCSSGHIKEPLYYYEDNNKMGTATRSKIFSYAKTPYVLILDSHVLIESNGVKKLIEFFESGKDNGNLLQAPLLYDSLECGPSKFIPQWRAGMLGTWAIDERAKGSEPFEIDGQGLGLFACRKNSWVGFSKNHSGFGSEECTVNDRFKSKEKKTLCLPWLKWLHRFVRPNGVPYENKYEDRIKNYFRSYLELDKPIFEIIEHFKTLGLKEKDMREWLNEVLAESVT